MKTRSGARAGLSAVLGVLMLAGSPAGAGGKANVALPEGYRAWNHVKSMVIFDKSHGLYGFHNVYVNDRGLKALRSGGSYPSGSEFVVAFYEPVKDEASYSMGKPIQYVVMKKDRRFKSTGGWAYEAYKAGDTKTPLVGAAAKEKCHTCHEAVRKDDFVYSKFVE